MQASVAIDTAEKKIKDVVNKNTALTARITVGYVTKGFHAECYAVVEFPPL